jgi:hypothetical protein
MYNPFVVACNYALDEFSRINVEGLPEFSPEKQIVFVRNHDRSVGSYGHDRNSRVMPDIVILGWDHFKELSKNKNTQYPASHKEKICTSGSDLNLVWNHVRSTVEMKFAKFPKRTGWGASFDKGFEALRESQPYVSPYDPIQPELIQPEPVENNRTCA